MTTETEPVVTENAVEEQLSVLEELREIFGTQEEKTYTFSVGISKKVKFPITIRRLLGDEYARMESLMLRHTFSQNVAGGKGGVDLAYLETLKKFYHAGFAITHIKGQSVETMFPEEKNPFLRKTRMVDFLLNETPHVVSQIVYDNYEKQFGMEFSNNDEGKAIYISNAGKTYLLEERTEPWYCQDTGEELKKVNASVPLD